MAAGWIFLIEFIGGMVLTMGWLKCHDQALYEERIKNPRRETQARWDKLFGLAMMVVWYF